VAIARGARVGAAGSCTGAVGPAVRVGVTSLVAGVSSPPQPAARASRVKQTSRIRAGKGVSLAGRGEDEGADIASTNSPASPGSHYWGATPACRVPVLRRRGTRGGSRLFKGAVARL